MVEIKKRLKRSVCLFEEDVPLAHLHLMEYTEDAATAGAQGAPMRDEEMVMPGEQIILWITDQPLDEWIT